MSRLTRTEIQSLVAPFVQRVGAMQGVKLRDCLAIAGDDCYDCLISHPIYQHGPAEGYIYPWNLVDFLDTCCVGRRSV